MKLQYLRMKTTCMLVEKDISTPDYSKNNKCVYPKEKEEKDKRCTEN